MGDAVFETYVRRHLLQWGKVKPHRLHREGTRYVSAKAQCQILFQMFNKQMLSSEEEAIVMRGRNAKVRNRTQKYGCSDLSLQYRI